MYKRQISDRYKLLKQEANTRFDNQLTSSIAPYKEDNLIQQEEIDRQKKILFKGSNEFRGSGYNEATRLKGNNITKIVQLTSTIDSLRLSEINRLTDLEKNEIDSLKKSLKTSPSSGNKMLSATLQVINMKVDFPQKQYVLMIGILSLILSVGLELIMWSAFTVLAINHGDFFTINLQSIDLKTQHKTINETVENMTDNNAKSYEREAKKWSDSLYKVAKMKSKYYMDQIKNMFK